MVQFVLEAFFSDLEDVCNIRKIEEILHVVQAVRFGIRVCEFSVDLRFTETLASHLEEPHQVVVLASVIGDLDNLCKVRGIFSFDIRI